MPRHTRYQGLIVKGDHVLLIKHRIHETGDAYWVIPGGGLEVGESETQCVLREMAEETNLTVVVDRMLFDEPAHPGGIYKRRKSYLCQPFSGTASPGYEPEAEAADVYAITEVRWFDLKDEHTWDERMRNDPITYPQIIRLRDILGYG